MSEPTTSGEDETPVEGLKRNVTLDVNVLERIRRAASLSLADQKTPAERMENSNADIAEQNAHQAKQNTLWRRFLFWSVYSIVMMVAVLAAVIIVLYVVINGAEASPAVISTWIAASVVQVIGLLLVITRHLFPSAMSS